MQRTTLHSGQHSSLIEMLGKLQLQHVHFQTTTRLGGFFAGFGYGKKLEAVIGTVRWRGRYMPCPVMARRGKKDASSVHTPVGSAQSRDLGGERWAGEPAIDGLQIETRRFNETCCQAERT
jgi:hypothetical protein